MARLVNTNYKVEDKFLTLIPITDGTAKVLYQKTIEYFNEKEIPYKRNMLGFASDGANVMFGGNNSMMTNLKNDIPNLFTMKCICHSFALCVSRACEKLPRGLENFCREVFNHIQNSPKRIELTEEEINKTKDILDAKEKKILSVDVNDERIHLPLMETYVGGMVPNIIRLKKDTQELDDDKLSNFYGKCKEFYIEA
ncbi:hypothetical protein WA026_021526 [Henosepilachna vigintioctopunctata]|uniref:DUF4371 domain-containing protein n=1 Tax=Henosepilachna vigintioctopunctata TaxID=420089 RepID=A0AAW1VBU7_9CUCU